MSTMPASRCSAARMTRHRKRRRQGTRCVTVDVSQSEVDALVVRGYLSEEERDNGAAIKLRPHPREIARFADAFHFDPTLLRGIVEIFANHDHPPRPASRIWCHHRRARDHPFRQHHMAVRALAPELLAVNGPDRETVLVWWCEPPCLSAPMQKWEDYLAGVKTVPDNALGKKDVIERAEYGIEVKRQRSDH
jgi:hypothetical protein